MHCEKSKAKTPNTSFASMNTTPATMPITVTPPHRVYFTNGVYLCDERRFIHWFECSENEQGLELERRMVHGLVSARREYTLDAYPPSEAMKAEVKHMFLKRMFRPVLDSDASPWQRHEAEQYTEDQATCFLRRLARAVAGHVEDRVCVVLVGERCSGKGVLMELIANCFGDYVAQAPSQVLQLPRRMHGDAAKEHGWMGSLTHARVVYSDDINPSKPMDTQALRTLCSGGDPVTVRTPYTNERSVTLQATPFLVCNAMPTWEAGAPTPRPSVETFRTGGRFHTLDELRNEHSRQDRKLANPPDMKSVYCKDRRVIDAFIQLVFDHYEA